MTFVKPIIYLLIISFLTFHVQAAEVSILPSNLTASQEKYYNLNISIDPCGAPITGCQLDLIFDPSLIKVNSISEGNFFKQDGVDTAFNSGTIDNTGGTVGNISCTIDGDEYISTPGIFAIINIKAIGQSGKGNIELCRVRVIGTESPIMGIKVNNADVNISSVMELQSVGDKTVGEDGLLHKDVYVAVNNDCPRWDVNGDGIVDKFDFILLLNHYNEVVGLPGPKYDVNEDGMVNIVDLKEVWKHRDEKTGCDVVMPTPIPTPVPKQIPTPIPTLIPIPKQIPTPIPTPIPKQIPISSTTISSGDGLKLNIGSDGNVEGITINECMMPMLSTRGGFSFREVLTDAPNLIANPGFEMGSDEPLNWSFINIDGNTPVYDIISHSGEKSIKISIPGTSDGLSGYPKSYLIEAEPLQYYTLSAWGKTEGVGGTYAPGIRVVELDENKKWLRQNNLEFNKGTNDWTQKQISFQTGINTKWVYIYANIWNSYGTFWVDEVELEPFFGPTIYLNVTLEQNDDGTVTQKAQANDIDFLFTYIPKGRYIELQGEIQDRSGADRVLQLMYNLPLNANGWRWGDYIRGSRFIDGNTHYENVYKIGDSRMQSTYPFASIDNSTHGLSIAVPMDVPRIYRSGYNLDNGYSIQYDFGLSNQTLKIGQGFANFTFIVFETDETEWGFRAVTKKYYELYPEFFEKRNEREGTVMWLWKIWGDKAISTIPNASDFGFAFDISYYFSYDWSNWRLQYDENNNFYSLQATEPWGLWRSFGDNSTKPSYDKRIAALNTDLNCSEYWKDIIPLNEASQSVINSAPYDINGKMYLDTSSYFWNNWGDWQQSYPTNPDPDIPSQNRFKISYKEYTTSFNKEGGFIDNWQFQQNASWDSIIYHSGSYSAKIEILENESKISGKWICNEIPVNSNTLYEFSVWGKTKNAGGNYTPAVRIVPIENGEANYSAQKNIHFDFGTKDWIRKKINFTTSENAVRIFIYANIWRGNGTFWLDDLELYEKGTSKNLVPNNGFEQGNLSSFKTDGISNDILYVDWAWGCLENYRKDHWKYVDLPLTFSYISRKPVLIHAFSQYEYLNYIKTKINPNLTHANIGYNSYAFYAHTLDILGNEIEDIESDTQSSYRRTLSYQKTNSNILTGKTLLISHDSIEKYIKNEMFYGIFPSINMQIDKERYWSNASFYERDRDLFKKYIPLIKDFSKAGWEPIPYANVSNPNIKVERYGYINKNNLYYTIGNDDLIIQNGTLNINLAKQGLNKSQVVSIEIQELTTNKIFTKDVLNGVISFNISVNPQDINIYKIVTA